MLIDRVSRIRYKVFVKKIMKIGSILFNNFMLKLSHGFSRIRISYKK